MNTCLFESKSLLQIGQGKSLLETHDLSGCEQDYDALFELLWFEPPVKPWGHDRDNNECPYLKLPPNRWLLIPGLSLLTIGIFAWIAYSRGANLHAGVETALRMHPIFTWAGIAGGALTALILTSMGLRPTKFIQYVSLERSTRLRKGIEILLEKKDVHTVDAQGRLTSEQFHDELLIDNCFRRALILFLGRQPDDSQYLPTNPKLRGRIRKDFLNFLAKRNMIGKKGW